MGSLRNPVGPLPSSIYWRRRAVMLSVLALLALLTVWIVTSGGGGGGNGANGSNGKNPAPTVSTITPGPSGSGPAISQAPGGRDESSGGDSNGAGSGGGSGDDGDEGSAGTGGTGGSEGAGGAGGAGGSAGSGGAGGEVGSGDAMPAGSSVPNCTSGSVSLTLRSVRNLYEPGQRPAFRLTAKNSSGSDCKVDLGPKTAVLTITQAASDDPYWSSADCPKGAGSLYFRVPAGSSVTYPVEWDRRPSAPSCATPPAGTAKAGTYLVEAKAPGYAKVQTSFVLEAD
ncbi:MAG: hypothetical protein H5T76_24875 [Streptomyces sp.]|nr:hypothetical protein [Streptomyces sp.]